MAAQPTPDVDQPAPTWPDVKALRRAWRADLIQRRMKLTRAEREDLRLRLADAIRHSFPWLSRHAVGFYWPIKGEPDLRHLMRDLIDRGATAALPVVVEKARPVEFWAWQPRVRMVRGAWNIPQPASREPIRPSALLVPLLGFAGFYRLGYGAGYYDRTLAALDPKPWTIGVGLELGRLETIYPQAHDIPMDAIVTEAGVWSSERMARSELPRAELKAGASAHRDDGEE